MRRLCQIRQNFSASPPAVVLRSNRSFVEEEVITRVRKKQMPAALQVFKKHLRIADGRTLESCLQRIGANGDQESRKAMLKGFEMFLEAGFHPSTDLWIRLHQVARTPLEDIYKLNKQSATSWIKNEKAVASLMQYHARAGRPKMVEAVFQRFQDLLKQDGLGRHPGPWVWKALIESCTLVGDLTQARKWFQAWRNGPSHPYYTFENSTDKTIAPTLRDDKLQQMFLPFRPQSALRLISSAPFPATMDTARNAHVLRSLPSPDPLPYLALLKGLSSHTMKGNKAALKMIRNMAADRVPLTPKVVNGIIHYELSRREGAMEQSILSLYQHLRAAGAEGGISLQPDRETFAYAFRAYREPRLYDPKRPHHPPLPTHFAREAELPPADPEYLEGPRRLLRDLWECRIEVIDTLMSDILQAFMNTRDFAGAAVVLQLYRFCRIEPTSRTHAIVVDGALRAARRGEAFTTTVAQQWLSAERVLELVTRVEDLDELAGFDRTSRGQITHVFRATVAGTSDIINPATTHPADLTPLEPPEYWNGRLEPRTPLRLRRRRQFEFRDIEYLYTLLQYASIHGTRADNWARQLVMAQEEMCAPLLARGFKFPPSIVEDSRTLE